jgi:hypothetical protein
MEHKNAENYVAFGIQSNRTLRVVDLICFWFLVCPRSCENLHRRQSVTLGFLSSKVTRLPQWQWFSQTSLFLYSCFKECLFVSRH